MPRLTKEQAEQKEAEHVPRLNCGLGLTTEQRVKYAIAVDKMKPKTDVEKRNKRILEYAILQDMNADQIARLGDPIIVSSRGGHQPLTSRMILYIIHRKFPDMVLRKPKEKTKEKDKRKELWGAKAAGEVKNPKVCACCGSKEHLELHHIVPIRAGGTNDYYNMAYMCQ